MPAKKRAPSKGNTSVRISPELLKRARIHGAHADLKIVEIVNAAVADYLKRKGA